MLLVISESYISSMSSQSIASTGLRPSPTIQGYEQDRSTIEMDMQKSRTFDTTPVTIGHGKAPKYGGVLTPLDWESERVITCPDIVITKTTDRHVT